MVWSSGKIRTRTTRTKTETASFTGLCRMTRTMSLKMETTRLDFTRATEVTPEVAAAVDDAFEYHPWDHEKVNRGSEVRKALALAIKVIINKVPPSPDRSSAIRKIREARMDCNSAITHDGKY